MGSGIHGQEQIYKIPACFPWKPVEIISKDTGD